VTPTTAATDSYTLACTGAGGTASGSASLTVAAVVVTPPPKSGGGGGGGAEGLWELLGLSTLGILARRRNRLGTRVAASR
jgi:hypothetical protein